MTTAISPTPVATPLLRDGDRLNRAEFERRSEMMPGVKAELLDGVVYMASPVTAHHAIPHFDLITWMGIYRISTPGIEGGDNGTLRLPLGSDPQPDSYLRILQTHGGKSRIDEEGYVAGVPELIAEIAYSSVVHDRNIKRPIFERDGVCEFILWRVTAQKVDWYVLRDGQYELLPNGDDGIVRSETFPGLWLDAEAMAQRDMGSVSRVLQCGLASPEHARFVERLASLRARSPMSIFSLA